MGWNKLGHQNLKTWLLQQIADHATFNSLCLLIYTSYSYNP